MTCYEFVQNKLIVNFIYKLNILNKMANRSLFGEFSQSSAVPPFIYTLF